MWRHIQLKNQKFLLILTRSVFPKVKNVDYEGLFGNISSVIDLSQRLLNSLHETDSIGKQPDI